VAAIVVLACLAANTPKVAVAAESTVPVPLSRVVDHEPAWSPDGSQIAFVSNRNGAFKVYAMHADGTELRQLTQGLAEDDAPAWSPDGASIVYVSMRDGDPEIYVMRADGSADTRRTRDPGVDIHPQWSPDGRSIVWNSSRNSRNRAEPETIEVFTMRADGSDVRQLTRGGISTYASWSPDGSRILIRKQLDDGNSEIFVMRPDGTELTNLSRDSAFDGWPAWSRDGKRVVFAREEGPDEAAALYVTNANASGVATKIVTLPGRCTNPRWSPVRDQLVFSRRAERQVRLYIVDVPGQ
jgi:TolB protein